MRPVLHHRIVAAATLVMALSGCGGGIYVGWSNNGDAPPDVSLASNVDAAFVGGLVRLVAAASDDFSVNRVEFYRIGASGGATFLGSDGQAPYQWDTLQPDSPTGRVRYYAVAVDDIGQTTTSVAVGVTVLR